jgi:predicted KAP-like P-loop ATPase
MSNESPKQRPITASFQTDRPKEHPDEDCLGRAGFAENLAEKIQAWQQKDSLVIGLEGPWGSGKSTIKNFVLHCLKAEGKVPHVEFNPWQFSGDDRLFEEFAVVVASVLPSKGKKAKKRKELWSRYSSYLCYGSKVTGALKLAASFSGIPGATLLLDQATQALDALGEMTSKGADTIGGGTEPLENVKAQLTETFRKLDGPLLVVIDDIDRLTNEEVALVFRLVKANADFPNLVYLMIYDRDYVEKSLDKITSSKGSEFLQKIVQMPIPVPAPHVQRIHREALNCMDRIVSGLPGNPASGWDKERWSNLWVLGLSRYFTDLRRSYRYANSCSFLLDNLRSCECMEIDVMDFLALEVLRFFEKSVYDRIQVSGDILTGRSSDSDGERKLDDLLLDILNHATDRVAVQEIVSAIFLSAKSRWENMGYGDSFMREATAKMRICSSDHFEKYFQLALPPGGLSRSRIEQVLQNKDSRESLTRIFDEAIRMEYVVPLLQALEHHNTLDEQTDPLPYLLALCDSVDSFPDQQVPIGGGILDVHPSTYAIWAVLRSVSKRRGEDKRADLLEATILQSEGLYMPAEILWIWHDRNNRTQDEESMPHLDEDREKQLRQHVLDRLGKAASSGQLSKHSLRGTLINLWTRWDSSACRDWIVSQLHDVGTALPLLISQINERTSQTLGSVYQRRQEYFDLEWLEKLAPLNEWKDAIGRIAAHKPEQGSAKRIKVAWECGETRGSKKRRKTDD